MSKNKGFSLTSAERYSLALYELANESNLLKQIESQSLSILDLIDSSEDFSNLIKDPTNSQEDLIKIYNLIMYKFSTDLTELGFETLGNQEIDFSININNANQILEQVRLQQDTMAIVSLLGSNRGNQGLSNLLIEPQEVDPNSSEAL